MARTVANRGASRDPAWLSEAYEARLRADPAARRRRGAFMTPPQLAQLAARESVDRWSGRGVPVVLDPACGTGNLLVAAAERLLARGGSPAAIASRLKGVEIEPEAARIARTRLEALLGGGAGVRRALARGIRVGDAVRVPAAWMRCDVVVANPPFLGQLRRGTVVDRAAAARWRARLGDAVRGYADPAAAFLLLSVQALRPGGRAAVILPRPMLAAASAQEIRDEVDRSVRLERIWMDDRFSFDAGTRVCILSLSAPSGAARASSPALVIHGEVQATLPWKFWNGRWGAAAAASAGVPALEVREGGRIGDLASVTADFRDQYYGLRGAILEEGRDAGSAMPRLVTTRHLDLAACRWGACEVRVLGEGWRRPMVDVARLGASPAMRAWLEARRVPKVLVATQTRVIEAWIDADGDTVPLVPLLVATPRTNEVSLARLAAAIASPVVAARAYALYAGSALSAGAIKISAKQLMAMPTPVDDVAWNESAAHFMEATRQGVEGCDGGDAARRSALDAFAARSCEAHALPRRETDTILAFWRSRVGLS